MKIIIENTDRIVLLTVENGGEKGRVPARIWEGKTDSGIPVHCFITRIAVAEGENTEQFEKELSQQKAPSPEIQAIPLYLVL